MPMQKAGFSVESSTRRFSRRVKTKKADPKESAFPILFLDKFALFDTRFFTYKFS